MFATLRGPDYKSPDFWGGRPRGGRGAGARHTEELHYPPWRAAACRPLSYGNPIACHLVGSVLRSRSKGEKEPHA
ncbi:unnamed protein product, partial [Staurois parvus]